MRITILMIACLGLLTIAFTAFNCLGHHSCFDSLAMALHHIAVIHSFLGRIFSNVDFILAAIGFAAVLLAGIGVGANLRFIDRQGAPSNILGILDWHFTPREKLLSWFNYINDSYGSCLGAS